MNKELFLDNYINEVGICEVVPCTGTANEVIEEVIIEYNDRYYRSKIVIDTEPETDRGRFTIVQPVVEVKPREIKQVAYDEVFEIRGTRNELIENFRLAFEELDYLYRNTTEPYMGSVETYEELGIDDIMGIIVGAVDELTEHGEAVCGGLSSTDATTSVGSTYVQQHDGKTRAKKVEGGIYAVVTSHCDKFKQGELVTLLNDDGDAVPLFESVTNFNRDYLAMYEVALVKDPRNKPSE